MLSGRRTPCVTLDGVSKYLAQRRGDLKWPVPLVKVVVNPDHPHLAFAARDEAAKLATEEAMIVSMQAAQSPPKKFIYLHELLSQAKANVLLTANGGLSVSGKFLVRSAAKEHAEDAEKFILSVVYKKKITHHVIGREDDGYLSITGRPTQCGTLIDLVNFLSQKQASVMWPVPLTEGVRAANGASPSAPESTLLAAPSEPYMWIPGDRLAAIKAVKKAAHAGDFLVRESSGRYVLVVQDFGGKVLNIKFQESSNGGFSYRGKDFATVRSLVDSLKAGSSKPLQSKDPAHLGENLFLNNGIPSH
jgi:hypothetical protein